MKLPRLLIFMLLGIILLQSSCYYGPEDHLLPDVQLINIVVSDQNFYTLQDTTSFHINDTVYLDIQITAMNGASIDYFKYTLENQTTGENKVIIYKQYQTKATEDQFYDTLVIDSTYLSNSYILHFESKPKENQIITRYEIIPEID